MEIKKIEVKCHGIKFMANSAQGQGRGFLYTIKNDLHNNPFGLLEDVFIDPSMRGKGHGTKLVEAIIIEAERQRLYKLIATSRYSRERVHRLYQRIGFIDFGKEFRLDL